MSVIVSFDKDFTDNKIVVTSRFNAPLGKIWSAFTNPLILGKWWAPQPYKAVTEEIDFREGGHWLYYMVSPEEKKTWSIVEFLKIQPQEYFEVWDAFCDENGVIDTKLPRMMWRNSFSEKDDMTTVVNTIIGEDVDDLKKIIEMGFEEGYKMGLNQLDGLLKSANYDKAADWFG